MDAALLIDLYRQMCLCRRFEEGAARAYAQGKIAGFLHLYIGQEAVAVGAISAAAPTDYIVATYREHAHYLARTGDARGAMAELYGKAGGGGGGVAGCISAVRCPGCGAAGPWWGGPCRSPPAWRSRRSTAMRRMSRS